MNAANFDQELREIAGESIGWILLEDRSYLHLGDADTTVVVVTGLPDAELADRTVLMLV